MGHGAAWDYTPRQISGFLFYARAREKREAAQALGIGAMAARGEPREVKKTLKEWSKP